MLLRLTVIKHALKPVLNDFFLRNRFNINKFYCKRTVHFFNFNLSLPFVKMKRSFALMSQSPEGEPLLIGTHDGVFHCDEVLACYLLKQLPELKNAEILRTRNQELLDTCAVVVDVGGIYDPERHRYDHHQRDFIHTLTSLYPEFPNKHIKLSSAGLIYAHFGRSILEKMLDDLELGEQDYRFIFLNVYENFIEEIDGIDNGVSQYPGEPKYRISTHISARVSHLNPEWNSPPDINVDKLFKQAMELVGKEFKQKVHQATHILLPARNLVKEAILKRYVVHDSGQIIELGKRCPWKEHLFQIEKELGIPKDIKFVLFRDIKDNWRVQGVPVEPSSFICRNFLREEWMGLRDEELCKVSGIPDCIFCHATGFIGGCQSREGVLAMAVKSLEQQKVFLREEWKGLRDETLSEVSGIPNCTFCHTERFIGEGKTRQSVLSMALKSLEQ